MHNTRAIGDKDLDTIGLTEQTFSQWKSKVEELRVACADYLPLAESEKATDKKIQAALDKVWMAWRDVCADGAGKEFNKNFFIRQNDAHTIVEWCNRKAVSTAHGKVWGQKEATDFRKHIETLIGIRMAGNKVLTDDERDLLTKYEGALKTIKHNEDALKDRTEQGKTTYGLRSKLKFAQNDLTEEEEFLASVNVDETTKEKRLKKYRDSVAEYAQAVAKAETAINKATKIRDDNKKAYDKAIALIKSVGDNR
jgi:hypothetical protein